MTMTVTRFLRLFFSQAGIQKECCWQTHGIHTLLSHSLPDTSVCISNEIRDGFLKISSQPTLIFHLSFQDWLPGGATDRQWYSSEPGVPPTPTPRPPSVPSVGQGWSSLLLKIHFTGLLVWRAGVTGVWPVRSPTVHAPKGSSLGLKLCSHHFEILYNVWKSGLANYIAAWNILHVWYVET